MSPAVRTGRLSASLPDVVLMGLIFLFGGEAWARGRMPSACVTLERDRRLHERRA